jgi:hypothetical protein
MKIDKFFVSLPPLLVAITVKITVPPVVGMPEISPVEAESDKPVGNASPLSSAHVIGAVPVAVKVWLY